MKVTPLAQGTGVAAGTEVQVTRSSSPDRIQRAKSIASGEQPTEAPAAAQAETAIQQNIRKIKMRTQVSTNREEPVPGAELGSEAKTEVSEQIPTNPISEPEAVVSEETRPLSPQFAALARQKRALQIERAALEKEKAELAQNSQVNLDEYVSKADLKSNPLKVFDAGLTYDDLTQAILNNPAPSIDPMKLRDEIKEELKKELFGELSTRDQQQEQQVLSEIRREAEALTTAGDEFETIRQAKALGHPDFANGRDAVVDLIHRTWQKTGEVLDTTEAARLIENQLIEDLLPFARIKTVQNKLTPEAPTPAPQQVAPSRPGVKVMRTLTNRDTANPANMDRRARALAAWNGTLKRG